MLARLPEEVRRLKPGDIPYRVIYGWPAGLAPCSRGAPSGRWGLTALRCTGSTRELNRWCAPQLPDPLASFRKNGRQLRPKSGRTGSGVPEMILERRSFRPKKHPINAGRQELSVNVSLGAPRNCAFLAISGPVPAYSAAPAGTDPIRSEPNLRSFHQRVGLSSSLMHW